MYGVANKDSDLEFDPLTNWKPVELVPQHRSDMVELPRVRDQPGSHEIKRYCMRTLILQLDNSASAI